MTTDPILAAPDVASFEIFFEAERRNLFQAMFLITGNASDAEELTQDAFLKVWERWERVRGMERATWYLYRVALNASRSRYRRAVRAAKHVFETTESVDPYPEADERDVIERAIRSLPARQRTALVISELLDLGSEQTAALIGVSPSTVRNLIAAAHRSLRTTMESKDG